MLNQAQYTAKPKRIHLVVMVVISVLLISAILAALLPDNAVATRHTAMANATDEPVTQAIVPATQTLSQTVDTTNFPVIKRARGNMTTTHEITIKPGDNLSKIFSELEVSPREMMQILELGEETQVLKHLMPGQRLRICIDDDKQIQKLVYEQNRRCSLHVQQQNRAFFAALIEREYETRQGHVSGHISRSLYEDAMAAGLDDKLIMELAGIFGWDIDFALDLRVGDTFSLIYEEQYLDGQRVASGPILAAEFTSQGTTYQAVRFTNKEGISDYFSPDGRSMRKTFLRSPVDFKRISSRFGQRKHPVMNKMRMHKGVDYAAAKGTPVRTTGNGKVIHIGKKGGYGNTIIIQHGTRYSTLYAHLNGFKRGLKKGSTVKQGQTVGFVGSTGLATGPHLHYEFRLNGVHRNPLTVKLPDAKPLEKKYLQDFNKQADPLLAHLKELKASTAVAVNK